MQKTKQNVKGRKPKEKSVNTVEEEPHLWESMSYLHSATALYESSYSSGEDNIFATNNDEFEKIAPYKMLIKIGDIESALLGDSGSACCFWINHLKFE